METYDRELIIDTPHNGVSGKYMRDGVYMWSHSFQSMYIEENISFSVREYSGNIAILRCDNSSLTHSMDFDTPINDLIEDTPIGSVSYSEIFRDGNTLKFSVNYNGGSFHRYKIMSYDTIKNSVSCETCKKIKLTNSKLESVSARFTRIVCDTDGNAVGWIYFNIQQSTPYFAYTDSESNSVYELSETTQVDLDMSMIPGVVENYLAVKNGENSLKVFVFGRSSSSSSPMYDGNTLVSFRIDLNSGNITEIDTLYKSQRNYTNQMEFKYFNSELLILSSSNYSSNEPMDIYNTVKNTVTSIINPIDGSSWQKSTPIQIDSPYLTIISGYSAYASDSDYIAPVSGDCYRKYKFGFLTFGFHEIREVKKGEKWKASCDGCVAFFKFPPYQELQIFDKNTMYEAQENCYIGVQGGSGLVTITQDESVMFS